MFNSEPTVKPHEPRPSEVDCLTETNHRCSADVSLPTPHFHSLDGLRGAAAVAVVIYHLCLVFPAGDAYRSGNPVPGDAAGSEVLYLLFRTPLAIFAAGKPAVLIFFVLSGFVLAYSYARSSDHGYRPYVVKRIARIGLPFAAAVLLSSLFYVLVYDGPISSASKWLNEWSWANPPTPERILGHLSMIGHRQRLLNVMWSLIIEFRISLVFPLLVWLFLRLPKLSICGTIILSLVNIVILSRVDLHAIETIAETLRYAYLFVIGIALATHLERVSMIVSRLPNSAVAASWFVAINLLLIRSYVGDAGGRIIWLFGDLLIAVGATLVVALCLRSGTTERVLAGRLGREIGRISYSLYLVHLPVILATVHFGWRAVDIGILAVLGALLAFPMAFLFNRTVERSSQRFGHWAARNLGQDPLITTRR